MEQRRFGDSDLVCSALGFGTWKMGTTQYGHIDVNEASAAVGWRLTDEDRAEIDRIFQEGKVPTYRTHQQAF